LLSHTSIAPSGHVAFRAATFGAPFDAIWTGYGAASATVLADASGPFSGFPFEAAIGRSSTAFLADLDAGGRGLFTGPDAIMDKVLQAGDSLFGETVVGFPGLNRYAVNTAGQITFLARLSSGDLVVGRATPSRSSVRLATTIPEPLPGAVTFLAGALVLWWRGRIAVRWPVNVIPNCIALTS
jgi:hypothetical protein